MEIKICLPTLNPEVGIFGTYCRILDSKLLVLLGNIIDKLLAGAATKLILFCLNSMIPILLSCVGGPRVVLVVVQAHRPNGQESNLLIPATATEFLPPREFFEFARLDWSSRIMRPTQLNPLNKKKCLLCSSAQLNSTLCLPNNRQQR